MDEQCVWVVEWAKLDGSWFPVMLYQTKENAEKGIAAFSGNTFRIRKYTRSEP